MKTMSFAKIGKDLGLTIRKHSPEILTGLGIVGMIATTVSAVRATPKALTLIDEKKKEIEEEELTPVETVATTWKCYVPTVILGITSISFILGANSINLRRNAALAAAYTLSETSLKDYKEKLIDTFGEKKEREVRKAIVKDKLEKDPVTPDKIIHVEKSGDTLCYDLLSGRYFEGDIEFVRKAVNEINRRLLLDNYISLNDFYEEIGLDDIKIGEDLGWRADDGLIDVDFGAQLAKGGRPCVVIDFMNPPKYGYNIFC